VVARPRSSGMALGALLMTVIFLVESAFGLDLGSRRLRDPRNRRAVRARHPAPLRCVRVRGISEETASRGYQLRNAAEGLNYPSSALGAPSWWRGRCPRSSLARCTPAIPNATSLSTFNIVLAGPDARLWLRALRPARDPIGLHLTWNFFQNAVYGLPVSGFGTLRGDFPLHRTVRSQPLDRRVLRPRRRAARPAAMLLASSLRALGAPAHGAGSRFTSPSPRARPVTSDPDAGHPTLTSSGSAADRCPSRTPACLPQALFIRAL
jgi:hypothetical protein